MFNQEHTEEILRLKKGKSDVLIHANVYEVVFSFEMFKDLSFDAVSAIIVKLNWNLFRRRF